MTGAGRVVEITPAVVRECEPRLRRSEAALIEEARVAPRIAALFKELEFRSGLADAHLTKADQHRRSLSRLVFATRRQVRRRAADDVRGAAGPDAIDLT